MAYNETPTERHIMPKTTEAPVDETVTEEIWVTADEQPNTKTAMLKNLAKNPRIIALAIAVTASTVAVIVKNSRDKNDEAQETEA